MRRILYILTLVAGMTFIVTPRSLADDGPYDKEEFNRVMDRFDAVVATGDTTAILCLADSLRGSDNYRIHFQYYEAMKFYHYLAGHSLRDCAMVLKDGAEDAKGMGKDGMRWEMMYLAIITLQYEDSAGALELAETMLAEANDEKSVLGLIRSYYALSFIYYYRNENMMAINQVDEAIALGEKNVGRDASLVSLLYETYMHQAMCYTNINKNHEAMDVLSKVEKLVEESSTFNSEQKTQRVMNIIAMRLQIQFGEEKYDEVRRLLSTLKEYPDYESFITNGNNMDAYFCILMVEGRDREAREFIEECDEEMRHFYLYLYYQYHGKYKEAIREWDLNVAQRDSISYKTRLSDMAYFAQKTKRGELERAQEELENRQKMIILSSVAGILLLIVGFMTLLYIRNRRHTRILTEKNVQLREARDEAEHQRDEAQAQRALAEEKRQEADVQKAEAEHQRNIADEQRALAEEKRLEAEEQKAEAEHQRNIADEQRALAEEKRLEAEEQKAEAEHQRNIADEQRALAEEKRLEAEEQKAEAEHQRNIADVARHQAEQANEMKGHFIENMMHEIRTPLNAISGFSQLIADPRAAEDPASMMEASDQIGRNTQHLVHLLDDIILISNYESLSVDIDMQDTSICETLLTCIMNAPQSPVGLQIQPEVENLADDPQMFSCQDMLQRAFGCLLDNAIKFTREGSITAGAEYDDQTVTFWVQDSGPGIPAGEEEHIFERFVKLDNFVPGTGLGLSLARAIINALDGEVKVDGTRTQEGEEGVGARFVIRVPRNLDRLGTGRPRQPLVMEPLPPAEGESSAEAPACTIPEEDILAVLEEMQKDDPNVTRDDVIAMLQAGGMM